MLTALIDDIHAYLPDEDCSLVTKAYNVSVAAHAGQRRASGEEYITHCMAVARILAAMRFDTPTIKAALLHDVLEDTSVTHEDLQREFGPEVTALVDGVTKISGYHFENHEVAQAENWRKMLLAVTKDVRVIIIKLADRLHNMRTIAYLPAAKQAEVAEESLYLYAPFAQRLGIYRWKSELEDLSFAVLHPDEFRAVQAAWEQREESRGQHLQAWQEQIGAAVLPYAIPCKISARPKSLYGIYKKMERQHKQLSEIQDLIGLRLVTDTVANCYALLGVVHDQWTPIAGSFTDYISVPKANMYQSLHTTVIGQNGVVAEIQIRTEEMHRRCEYGIAAHWRYKEGGVCRTTVRSTLREVDNRLDWLRQLLEWQNDNKDPRELLAALKTECTFDQIFVFTPKGKVITLPAGATAVDFAYAVHSDIGDHCFGAMVNGKLQPLQHQLVSGDICTIITRKNARPTKHWLEHALTAHARSRIRKYFREHGEH